MSETPEEPRPAPVPESPPEPSPAPPAASPAPPAATRPAAAASKPAQPVYQGHTFQLVAVGIVGLLLGGVLGLGIGLTAGFAFGGRHDRGDVHHHQQWGPGDGFHHPDRKRLPDRPFVPPVRKQPVQPSPAAPSPAAPSPQSS